MDNKELRFNERVTLKNDQGFSGYLVGCCQSTQSNGLVLVSIADPGNTQYRKGAQRQFSISDLKLASEEAPSLFVFAQPIDNTPSSVLNHILQIRRSKKAVHMSSSKLPNDWEQLRRIIFARDNHRCVRCDKKFKVADLTAHHIIPRAKGGGDYPENLITLCSPCHDFVECGEYDSRAEIIGSLPREAMTANISDEERHKLETLAKQINTILDQFEASDQSPEKWVAWQLGCS